MDLLTIAKRALIVCVSMAGLLLGASAAEAQTVVFGNPQNPTQATGINGLNIRGNLFDIVFEVQQFAFEAYGPFPGTFTAIDSPAEAEDAVAAVNNALNLFNATSIGEEGVPEYESDAYAIGFEGFLVGDPGGPDIESIYVWRASKDDVSDWWSGLGQNELTYNLDERDWAVLRLSVPAERTSWGELKSLFR